MRSSAYWAREFLSLQNASLWVLAVWVEFFGDASQNAGTVGDY